MTKKSHIGFVATRWKMLLLIVAVIISVSFIGLERSDLYFKNKLTIPAKLSEYGIFKDPRNLHPNPGFIRYEIATSLFTDYAEKERLIRIPADSRVVPSGDNLPVFPIGTMLIKTFFYYNDARDTSKGRRLIETRVETRDADKWNLATYVWNKDQTEAFLVNDGGKQEVSWINASGERQTLKYKIPSAKDCSSCHKSGGELQPIGPKSRNLNMEVTRDGCKTNQLAYLQKAGILSAVDPASFGRLPGWKSQQAPLHDRVRAYLDINCAHCHSENGSASRTRFRFDYGLPVNETGIAGNGNRIIRAINSGRMPRSGTTVVDEEALGLIKIYFKELQN